MIFLPRRLILDCEVFLLYKLFFSPGKLGLVRKTSALTAGAPMFWPPRVINALAASIRRYMIIHL